MLSGICRFLGLMFCDFLAISLRMPFKNKFAIWGLILGPCFCRNPFLWRAIDFRFLLSRFRYFLWILEFLLLLLLCFSTSLLFCVFALLFSACMLFLLFRYFVFFLLFCFSAFLASLCSASLFFFPFFPASLLFSNLNCASSCNKQIPSDSRFHQFPHNGNLLITGLI